MSRVPRPRRADELPLQRKCTLGCPVIDQLLRGGVATGVVTEVFGGFPVLLSLSLRLKQECDASVRWVGQG